MERNFMVLTKISLKGGIGLVEILLQKMRKVFLNTMQKFRLKISVTEKS